VRFLRDRRPSRLGEAPIAIGADGAGLGWLTPAWLVAARRPRLPDVPRWRLVFAMGGAAMPLFWKTMPIAAVPAETFRLVPPVTLRHSAVDHRGLRPPGGAPRRLVRARRRYRVDAWRRGGDGHRGVCSVTTFTGGSGVTSAPGGCCCRCRGFEVPRGSRWAATASGLGSVPALLSVILIRWSLKSCAAPVPGGLPGLQISMVGAYAVTG
jgi:hypothetical protein